MIERIKISENFYLDEFWDAQTYHEHRLAKNLSSLIDALDDDMLYGLQAVRTFIDSPMSINDWWSTYVSTDGNIDKTLAIIKAKKIDQWSGVRFPTSQWYSKGSRHSFPKCDATDSTFKTQKLLQIAQSYVYYYWKELKITAMEVNVSWFHIDSRPIYKGQSKLFTFDMDSAEPNWKPKYTKQFIDNYK
jgi:hypothetical protein